MSRRPSVDVHAAAKPSAATGLNRRKLGWSLVLGFVFLFATPAAQATNGDPVILGAGLPTSNQASATTEINTTSGTGLVAMTTDPGSGNAGVYGYNSGGGNGNGVQGIVSEYGNGNGVYGLTPSSTASGVYGENNNGGYGVAGRTTKGGVAMLADTADGTGTALQTTGKLQFQNRSGIAVFPSGAKSKTVTQPGVTASSMVLATVQQTGGYFVTAAVPAASSFTVYINKAPPSPAKVKVAYLVLN